MADMTWRTAAKLVAAYLQAQGSLAHGNPQARARIQTLVYLAAMEAQRRGLSMIPTATAACTGNNDAVQTVVRLMLQWGGKVPVKPAKPSQPVSDRPKPTPETAKPAEVKQHAEAQDFAAKVLELLGEPEMDRSELAEALAFEQADPKVLRELRGRLPRGKRAKVDKRMAETRRKLAAEARMVDQLEIQVFQRRSERREKVFALSRRGVCFSVNPLDAIGWLKGHGYGPGTKTAAMELSKARRELPQDLRDLPLVEAVAELVRRAGAHAGGEDE